MDQISDGFISDVSSQRDEASADDPERHFFVALAAANVRIYCHAPQQSNTRSDFNKTVDTEAEQRNAASRKARGNRHQAFQRIPCDGEILQALTALRNRPAIESNLCHVSSISAAP